VIDLSLDDSNLTLLEIHQEKNHLRMENFADYFKYLDIGKLSLRTYLVLEKET